METFSVLLAICAGNSPVPGEFPHKGQWRGALMFSLIYARINGWVNTGEAGDLRRYRVHCDVTVMYGGAIRTRVACVQTIWQRPSIKNGLAPDERYYNLPTTVSWSGGKDSPLGCLYLSLAYRHYFLWRRNENMSPCTGGRVKFNYEWIASWIVEWLYVLILRLKLEWCHRGISVHPEAKVRPFH